MDQIKEPTIYNFDLAFLEVYYRMALIIPTPSFYKEFLSRAEGETIFLELVLMWSMLRVGIASYEVYY